MSLPRTSCVLGGGSRADLAGLDCELKPAGRAMFLTQHTLGVVHFELH